MIALAAAISIDFDYFSQHSHGPGMMPGFLYPMPIPSPSYPPSEPEAGGTEAGSPEGAPPVEAVPAGESSSLNLLVCHWPKLADVDVLISPSCGGSESGQHSACILLRWH